MSESPDGGGDVAGAPTDDSGSAPRAGSSKLVAYQAASGQLEALSISDDGTIEREASRQLQGSITDVASRGAHMAVALDREADPVVDIYKRASLDRLARIEVDREADMASIVGITWRGARQIWGVTDTSRVVKLTRSSDEEDAWSQDTTIELVEEDESWHWTAPVVYGSFLFVAGAPVDRPGDSQLAVVDLLSRERIVSDNDSTPAPPLALEGVNPCDLAVGRGGRVTVTFAGHPDKQNADETRSGAGVARVDASTLEPKHFFEFSDDITFSGDGDHCGARVDDATIWMGSPADSRRAWRLRVLGAETDERLSSLELPVKGVVSGWARTDDSLWAVVEGTLFGRTQRTEASSSASFTSIGTIGSVDEGHWSLTVPSASRQPRYLRSSNVTVEGEFQGAVETIYGPPQGGGGAKGSLDVLEDVDTLTIELDGEPIVDGPGADIVVFENVFSVSGQRWGRHVEPGRLSFSRNGDTWHTYPTSLNEMRSARDFRHYTGFWGVTPTYASSSNGISPRERAGGGDPFDLARLDLKRARYIRLEYWSYDELPAIASPPDLDAILIRHD